MTLCTYCHTPIDASKPFCPQCGQTTRPPSASAPPTASSVADGDSRRWIKIALLIVGLGFFLLLFVAIGIVGVVFYQLKQSDANKVAVAALYQSPEAKNRLGEIEKVGWPIGSLSTEGGGSGSATFSMSVKGSLSEGRYYATLAKVDGLWSLQSGRVKLKDGSSVALNPSSVSAVPQPSEQSRLLSHNADSQGETLTSDRSAASSWRRVEWPEQGISFEVPGDWTQTSLTQKEFQFRSPDSKAYFIGNLVFFDQKIPHSSIIEALLQQSAPQLKRREIVGYARRDFGKAHGVLRIIDRQPGEHKMATWTGYYDTPEFGTVSVSFLLGASTGSEFEKIKPLLGAILDSVKFP